jgi:hypothetical protein
MQGPRDPQITESKLTIKSGPQCRSDLEYSTAYSPPP